jgi:hypothetical protein
VSKASTLFVIRKDGLVEQLIFHPGIVCANRKLMGNQDEGEADTIFASESQGATQESEKSSRCMAK